MENVLTQVKIVYSKTRYRCNWAKRSSRLFFRRGPKTELFIWKSLSSRTETNRNWFPCWFDRNVERIRIRLVGAPIFVWILNSIFRYRFECGHFARSPAVPTGWGAAVVTLTSEKDHLASFILRPRILLDAQSELAIRQLPDSCLAFSSGDCRRLSAVAFGRRWRRGRRTIDPCFLLRETVHWTWTGVEYTLRFWITSVCEVNRITTALSEAVASQFDQFASSSYKRHDYHKISDFQN